MPREASEMFQCIKYEDKREVFGLKIHSFSTLDRIKKYDDSDNEKNAEKPYSIKVGETKRTINLYFYEVDIREIIDGERKSENMDNETKATLKKVAKYATEENQKRYKRLSTLLAASIALGFVCYLLFGSNYIGVLYGTVPEDICDNITSFTSGLTAAGLVLYFLHLLGAFDKVGQWKKKCRENKR